MSFKLISPYSPSGDQPRAIEALVHGLEANKKHQTLLGVTGSGKTYTMANIIATLNKPALVIAHNKTLAAQLCAEFKAFFPENAVEYFVSYYDYYQPEAYIPSRDAYIEKEADINSEIERLRHSATRSLFIRNDVIIVASVSCIYGLGMPETYLNSVIHLSIGEEYNRTSLLYELDKIQYERNDIDLKQGRYRIKGETIDLFPSWEENILRLSFFGDELESIHMIHPVTGQPLTELSTFSIFPATHYVIDTHDDHIFSAIKSELHERVAELKKENKELEAHRLTQRTNYDLEMMKEVGYCKGIENYSRHLAGRKAGETGGVLLDFFPKDFITFIDESHVTLPQIRGMYKGDQSRKQALVDHGFRLPSAKDNRPLTFEEFEQKVDRCIYVSATPGDYELEHDPTPIEQIVRPTGLVDPHVEILPTQYQIDHLITEVQSRIAKKERVLVTALTKQFSEDLCQFLQEKHIKVRYLHSDIKALDRLDILHDLRLGKFDVLIGVNLLREGLDIPEVSLVAILDADKEGFLRNERSLIQTMGRAARHINGKVLLYADKVTGSMEAAIRETNRRRHIQMAYNKQHGITPLSISKTITDIRSESRKELIETEKKIKKLSATELPSLLEKLEADMNKAAKALEFELAAVIRDQIEELKGSL